MIRTSPVTFFLIIILVALSVGIYSGMQFCSDSIIAMGNRYYTEHNFYDMKIESAKGLTDKDREDLLKLPGIKNVQGFYYVDTVVTLGMQNVITRVFSDTPGMNSMTLIEGKMPSSKEECAMEWQYAKQNSIVPGDIVLVNDKKLSVSRLTVTALVETPLLVTKIGKNMHGNSKNGDGEILLYLITGQESFCTEAFMNGYSGLYATFEKDSEHYGYHSEAYTKLYQSLYSEVTRLPDTDYRVYSSESNPSFLRHSKSMNSLDNIALVIAGIFFLVSVVVCYSTVFGMIYDEKQLVGMQKALGFTNMEIYFKYIRYSLSAALSGVLIGSLFGVFVMEKLTYNAVLGDTYVFTGIRLSFRLPVILLFTVVLMVVLLLASAMACKPIMKTPAHVLLSGNDAELLKPSFVERKTFFQKLPLSVKIVFRNIFNDKKSFLTALVCVIGCMALMGTSVSIRNGMTEVPKKQFYEIQNFDRIVYFKPSAPAEEKMAMQEILSRQAVEKQVMLADYFLTFQARGLYYAAELTAGSETDIGELYRLKNLKKEKIAVPKDGVLISRKIHEVYGFCEGDKITLTALDGLDYEFLVGGVFENYIGHKILCTPEYYQTVTGKQIPESCFFVRSGESSDEIMTEKLSAVESFQYLENTEEQGAFLIDVASIMVKVVAILIVFAVILSFSVLVNLSFMSLRRKNNEIAIMRLLGFGKVTVFFYAVREIYLATIIGIFLSYPLVRMITAYATRKSEVSDYQYMRELSPDCFLAAAGITICFSIIVSLFTINRINKINASSVKR